MTYSIQHILEIVNGKSLNTVLLDTQIERLLFDSRHLVFPARTLFFAFKSNRQNGHQFIGELYEHCLLYTSPSPRDATLSRMPSSA